MSLDIGKREFTPPPPAATRAIEQISKRAYDCLGEEGWQLNNIQTLWSCHWRIVWCRMVYPHYPPSVPIRYVPCTSLWFCYMNLLKGTNSITRCSGELTRTQKTKNMAELLFSIPCCYRSNHHSENAHINITLAVIVTYEYIIAGDRAKWFKAF